MAASQIALKFFPPHGNRGLLGKIGESVPNLVFLDTGEDKFGTAFPVLAENDKVVACRIFQGQQLCPFHRKPFGGLLFADRLFDFLQIGLRLPFAGELLAYALVVHINGFGLIVPNRITVVGFNQEKPFLRRQRAGCGDLLRLTQHFIGAGGRLTVFVLLLRKGDHLVKIKIGKIFVEVAQILAGNRADGFPIHLIHQSGIHKVGADFNSVLSVMGSGHSQINVMKVGKIRFLFKYLHTVTVDQALCFHEGRRLCFLRHNQVVVHGIVPHLRVELCPWQHLIDQGEANVKQPDFVSVKGKDFVFLCAKIDGIAQMVFVPGVFFFGRCVFLRGAAQNLPRSRSFGGSLPHFLRLFQIGGVMLFFLGGKVAVKLYQFRNPLGRFIP